MNAVGTPGAMVGLVEVIGYGEAQCQPWLVSTSVAANRVELAQ